MRITPLDIRKQEFRKTMRGLDTDEVYAFLSTVADEYEAVLSDNKKLREHIVELEDRLKEFKSMETNLRNTLLTAERITSEAKENARREAGLIVREAEIEAEKAAETIRAHTQQLRREILELKKQKDNYITRLRTLLDSHRGMIDGFEDDFAAVDREIEEIGKKVDEDIKNAIPASRMSRDKITEDYAHQPSDKVTWDEERKREETPRPRVPRPQWHGGDVSKKDKNESAPADHSTPDASPGSGPRPSSEPTLDLEQDREENLGDKEAVPSQANGFGNVDATHVTLAEDDPGLEDTLTEYKMRHDVAQSIEKKLYPEAPLKTDDVADSRNENAQPQEGREPGQPGQEIRSSGPVARDQYAPGMDNAETEAGETPRPGSQTGTAVYPQPGQAEPRELPESQLSRDDWKTYEVQDNKPDWSNYEIGQRGAGPGLSRMPADPRHDHEVDEALSGLTEMQGTDAPPPPPEKQQDQVAPPQAKAPTPPASQQPLEIDEVDSGETWSMEELRKNLTNLSGEEE
ncbi:MAG: DivIVA domain-containing protein [Candidatus Krumholzibacteriota bacterium]|nr:DivIVA domain-containing protein [Candidatus Krumholzibacteriota bacterium]